jgi:hypothetical protein
MTCRIKNENLSEQKASALMLRPPKAACAAPPCPGDLKHGVPADRSVDRPVD